MKGHKCKGRRPNGQLKKGYTLKNGRVVRANTTRKLKKNADKSHQKKGLLCYESSPFCISTTRIHTLSI